VPDDADSQRLERLRERLARDSEILRRSQLLIAASGREGYGRGWRERGTHEEAERERLLAQVAALKLQLAQAKRELAAAQALVGREPTQALPAIPPDPFIGRPPRRA
jgi:hypothetical protein